MELLDWIKANVKEGAKIEEAQELMKGINPLDGLDSKDKALELIEKNQMLKAALDSETSKRIERHDEKFKSEKLPELIKQREEELRKELQPEETPEQKRIRELEEKLNQKDQAEQLYQKKLELREKAKQYAEEKGIQYDSTRAEKFAQFGDDAEKLMIDSIDYMDTYGKSLLDSKLKDTYRGNAPKGNNGQPADINEQIAEAKKNGDLTKASHLAFQKAREQQTKE
jgi:hypothetical protein